MKLHREEGRPTLENRTPAPAGSPDEASALLPGDYAGLRLLQAEFARYQRRAFPPRGANFFALELAGEAGEVANLEKKAWTGRDVPEERFADEAADVFIALLNYANARGVDLPSAVREKMTTIDERRRFGSG